MATNKYGLDVAYFQRWFERSLKDLSNYTSDELARELARMSMAANKNIVCEPEFSNSLPRELTSENGAKSLMIGEFFETIELECPDCDGGDFHELQTERCGTCRDSGIVIQKIPVEWTTIKAIYAKAVEHFGAVDK